MTGDPPKRIEEPDFTQNNICISICTFDFWFLTFTLTFADSLRENMNSRKAIYNTLHHVYHAVFLLRFLWAIFASILLLKSSPVSRKL